MTAPHFKIKEPDNWKKYDYQKKEVTGSPEDERIWRRSCQWGGYWNGKLVTGSNFNYVLKFGDIQWTMILGLKGCLSVFPVRLSEVGRKFFLKLS